MENRDYPTGMSTGTKEKMGDQATEMKEKLVEQAKGVKEKMMSQANQMGEQLATKIDSTRERTAEGLKTTSKRIDRLAMYIQAHDSKQMSEALMKNSQQYVRQNPGKSLVFGLVAGVLLGRLFSGFGRMGGLGRNGHRVHHH